MSDLFEEEEEDLTELENNIAAREDFKKDQSTLDARRRLENMLEEKRLRRELEDFIED